MATKSTTPALGSMITYADRYGRIKPAMIVATPETLPEMDAMSGTPAVEPGHFHVRVFSFTGSQYVKTNVSMGPAGAYVAPEPAPADDTAELEPAE